jgi:hypothetical protein
MGERFIVVEAANVPHMTGPARRLGDKGGLWVIFDTLYGGPPTSSHASTTLRSVAELHCRALNAYNVMRLCGGDHCSQLWNLPCDDPAHRRAPPITMRPAACEHPYRAVYFNPFNNVIQCHRCGEVIAPVLVIGPTAPTPPEAT